MRYSFSSIEPLEPRIAPAALAAKLFGGLLKIAGDPVAPNVAITQTGGSIEVFDGATSLGIFAEVKSIDLRPTGGVAVTLFLAGEGLSGPCKITATGPTTVDIAPSSNLNGGLTFIGDAATQNLNLADGVTVGKALIFKGSDGDDGLVFGKAITIGANVALTAVEEVFFLGEIDPVTIAGNFTVSNVGVTLPCSMRPLGDPAAVTFSKIVIGGGFTYIGGKSNDSVSLKASITKSAMFVDRAENNSLAFAPGSVVHGSVTMTTGAGTDYCDLDDATIDGNVTLKFAGGNSGTSLGSSTIGGNLIVTGDSGNDQVQTFGKLVTVTKNVSFQLGDGENNVDAVLSLFGTKLLINTGSGVDSVTCEGSATGAAAFISLGDGGDTVNGALFRSVKSANFQGGGGMDTYHGGTFAANPIVVTSFEVFI